MIVIIMSTGNVPCFKTCSNLDNNFLSFMIMPRDDKKIRTAEETDDEAEEREDGCKKLLKVPP